MARSHFSSRRLFASAAPLLDKKRTTLKRNNSLISAICRLAKSIATIASRVTERAMRGFKRIISARQEVRKSGTCHKTKSHFKEKHI